LFLFVTVTTEAAFFDCKTRQPYLSFKEVIENKFFLSFGNIFFVNSFIEYLVMILIYHGIRTVMMQRAKA